MTSAKLADNICKAGALQILFGNSESNEFSDIFKYSNLTAFPKSLGIGPVKLFLLMSMNVKFGRKPKPDGIEPLSWLF